MPVKDEMSLKQALRKEYKAKRKAFCGEARAAAEEKILHGVLSLEAYKACDALFTYISTENEVDTRKIIAYALKDGKKVAVPVCFGNGNMSFYYIDSLEQTKPDYYGIYAPEPSEEKKAKPTKNSLCIVPALAFDGEGNRLGMGGGYYDRFLSSNPICTAGLCFDLCLAESLPHESFDMKVRFVITETKIITIGNV